MSDHELLKSTKAELAAEIHRQQDMINTLKDANNRASERLDRKEAEVRALYKLTNKLEAWVERLTMAIADMADTISLDRNR